MREIDGKLSWADVFESRSGTDVFEDLDDDSDGREMLGACDDLSEDSEDFVDDGSSPTEDFFSARRATKHLLSKYPDAFKYDPKEMHVGQFLQDGSGITEFGWLYLQMLAYAVSGRHYRYEDQGSLNTLAVADCAWWLDEKVRFYSGKISNLRAIIYTRMRNTMSNSLYKHGKYLPTEDKVLDRNTAQDTIVCDGKEIDPFILDYAFVDVKEAHLMSLFLWDLARGTSRRRRRRWMDYRFASKKKCKP